MRYCSGSGFELLSDSILISILISIFYFNINFDEGRVIDKANWRIRKTLESWHTAITSESDNNSKPLPEQYRILIHKI